MSITTTVRVGIAVALAMAAFAFSPGAVRKAAAACNYNSDAVQNCNDAVHDYFNKTINNQSSSYNDVTKRVDSARDTLRECYNCAVDKVDSAVNSSTSTSTSTSTDSDE